MEGVMHVLELKVNLLSISSLEDEGYEVVFKDGTVLIQSKGVGSQDVAVRLGIREGMMYKLLGQPVRGSMRPCPVLSGPGVDMR